MSFTDLPPEILTMIVESIHRRRDLGAWRRTCKQNENVLRQHRESMVTTGAKKYGLDFTQSEIDTSSPEAFLSWMRAAPRKDDVIIDQSQELFCCVHSFECKCRSLCETQVKKRNATIILHHIRDHMGHDPFMEHFEESVQYCSTWATDIVSALSRNHTDDGDDVDKEDDKVNKDHKLALRLGRFALQTLFRDRRLYQDELVRSMIEAEIEIWTIKHEANLLKSNTPAAAKSMLDHLLAQEVRKDELVQVLVSTSR